MPQVLAILQRLALRLDQAGGGIVDPDRSGAGNRGHLLAGNQSAAAGHILLGLVQLDLAAVALSHQLPIQPKLPPCTAPYQGGVQNFSHILTSFKPP